MYRIIATVRKRGAIGVIYQKEFVIEGTSDIKDKWFELHGNEWELFHFDKIEKVVE